MPHQGVAIPSPRGPSAPCRLSARRQRTAIGANSRGETLESRTPRGESPTTSERIGRSRGLGHGHLFFIVARLSHEVTERDLVELEEMPIKPGSANVGFARERAREIGCWKRPARAAGPLLARMIHEASVFPSRPNRATMTGRCLPAACGAARGGTTRIPNTSAPTQLKMRSGISRVENVTPLSQIPRRRGNRRCARTAASGATAAFKT